MKAVDNKAPTLRFIHSLTKCKRGIKRFVLEEMDGGMETGLTDKHLYCMQEGLTEPSLAYTDISSLDNNWTHHHQSILPLFQYIIPSHERHVVQKKKR